MSTDIAIIVGAGSGLSASLARLFSREGMRVALAARHPEKLADLCTETKARAYACDATDPGQVARFHAQVGLDLGDPTLVVYNAGSRLRGAIETLEPERVQEVILANCFGVGVDVCLRLIAATKSLF